MKKELLLKCREILLNSDVDNPNDQKAISVCENYIMQLYKPYQKFCIQENYEPISEQQFLLNILNEGFFKKLLVGAAGLGALKLGANLKNINNKYEGGLSQFAKDSGGVGQTIQNVMKVSNKKLTVTKNNAMKEVKEKAKQREEESRIAEENAKKQAKEQEEKAKEDAKKEEEEATKQAAEEDKKAKEEAEAEAKRIEEENKRAEEENKRAEEAAKKQADVQNKNNSENQQSESSVQQEAFNILYNEYYDFCFFNNYNALSKEKYFKQLKSYNEGFFKKLLIGAGVTAATALAARKGYNAVNQNAIQQGENGGFKNFGKNLQKFRQDSGGTGAAIGNALRTSINKDNAATQYKYAGRSEFIRTNKDGSTTTKKGINLMSANNAADPNQEKKQGPTTKTYETVNQDGTVTGKRVITNSNQAGVYTYTGDKATALNSKERRNDNYNANGNNDINNSVNQQIEERRNQNQPVQNQPVQEEFIAKNLKEPLTPAIRLPSGKMI